MIAPVLYLMGVEHGANVGYDEAMHDVQDRTLTAVVENIVDCESGGDHSQKNPSGAFGVAQFKKRTFNWMKGLAGRPELQWTSEDDQLWLLSWALRNGYGGHWVCYDQAVKSLAKGMMEELQS
jgi:hypothetical protein